MEPTDDDFLDPVEKAMMQQMQLVSQSMAQLSQVMAQGAQAQAQMVALLGDIAMTLKKPKRSRVLPSRPGAQSESITVVEG